MAAKSSYINTEGGKLIIEPSPADKAALTREIKQLESYYSDLLEMAASQGDQFYYKFTPRGPLRERWMYLGEWFYPSTIEATKIELESAKKVRNKMDERRIQIGTPEHNELIKKLDNGKI